MSELAEILPTQIEESKIQLLEQAMLQEEQVDCPVTHKFGPGIYIREVFLPAGAYVVGHHHNDEHLNIMLTGRLKFFGKDGKWEELEAPQTFTSPAGRKVAFVYEDTIWQNIYATDKKDGEEIENEILTKSITWEEAQKYNNLQLTFDHSEDFKDYYQAIKECGLDHQTLRNISLNEDDQIDFPYGSYSVQVSKSTIEGKGLFATAAFEEGDIIAPARLDNMRTPAGRFINHSKKPNAFFVSDDNNDIYVVAGKDIVGCKGGVLGEEITVNYRQALNLSNRG